MALRPVVMAVFLAIAMATGPSCMDHSNRPIEWWVMLKMPSGDAYAYADANNELAQVSGGHLQDKNDALAFTMKWLFSANQTGYAAFAYNDESPDNDKHETYGHTKGDFVFSKTGAGFWLIHSVPRFPTSPENSQYNFPDEELDYGQSFLCMSINNATAINQIGFQFLVDKSYVYYTNWPAGFSSSNYPNLQALVDKKYITRGSSTSTIDFQTNGGKMWKSMSKNAEWNNDIWEFLVSPTIKSGLWIETWMNGADANKMPTYCTSDGKQYDNMNIRTLSLGDVSWKETQDHSKWGVSQTGNWVCIGGVNRQFSMAKRGGNMNCFVNKNIWDAFKAIIVTADKC